MADLVRPHRTVVALNKSDRPQRLAPAEIQGIMPGVPTVPVSATTRQGVPALEVQLADVLQPELPSDTETPLVTNVRHLDALRKAEVAVQRAQTALAAGHSPELLVVDVREALDQLGLVTGETINDELLEAVFSQFCIGK